MTNDVWAPRDARVGVAVLRRGLPDRCLMV